MARDGQPSRLPYLIVPGLVLLVGACATVLAVLQVLAAADSRDADRLRLEANTAESALEERLESHNALLRGTAGLFAGSDSVDAAEFAAYVNRLGLGTRYPGVTGIGFARWAEGETGRRRVEADMRAQGFADFRIWPEGPRPAYVPVTYITPLDVRNRAALGFDMYSEARRREAIRRSANTGQLAASGKVELVQEIEGEKQPGFLIYLAVRDVDTGALEGLAYSPLRAGDLLATVFPERPDRLVDVEVFDGDPRPENRLFATEPQAADKSRLDTRRRVMVAGRPWTLVVSTRPAFEEGGSRDGAILAAIAGGLVTLALTLAVLAQARGAHEADRARAALRDVNAGLEDRVEARTRELRDEMARREAAEDQVRQMQKMEAIGQLSGGIAHDFNNMLAIVIGSLDMARRRLGEETEPRVRTYLDNAAEGARRAALLTGRLLAFARRQQLNPEPIDPNGLVGGMTDLLQRALGERVTVETDLAPDLWPVHADAAELENALLNLAVNARDAMPDGGRLVIATANTSGVDPASGLAPGDYVAIHVRDNGQGMAPDVLDRAFEPFFTTKQVGRGTGLGLSQVYGFVRQSGGQVTVDSAPGDGTCVTIVLPRWTGVVAAAAGSAETTAVAGARDGETVLVVEDEAEVRRLSAEALRELGYAVVEAPDAARALALLPELPRADLLFTDIVMPGLNGFQLAEQARALRPDLKVLYTTGYAHGAAGDEAAVAAAVLAKPFAVDQLARKVRDALDGVTGRAA